MAAEPGPGMTGIDLKVLKKVLKFMEDAGLTELDIEMEGVKVRLRKGGAPEPAAQQVQLMPMMQHAPAAPAPVAAPAAPALAPASPAAVAPAAPVGVQIKAPMVGTFYRAPSPTSPPFVNPGDVIKEGQTLCLIEAMKLMNEIKAEVAGKIAKILIENGQPVEFDQAMFELE